MKQFSKLYWRISAVFLSALLLFGIVSTYISIRSTHQYALETNQKLNWELAGHTAHALEPFVEKGRIDSAAIQDIMHSMMVINPSVEVYLLDEQGSILSYVAPKKVVKLKKVDLKPIKDFLQKDRKDVIEGDDPREPGVCNIFSAAPVFKNQELYGYVYIVLASQEFVSVTDMLDGSFIMKFSALQSLLILAIAAILGLWIIWFITRKLNVIIAGINAFRSGQLESRIALEGQGELSEVADTFNNMAETIQENIEQLKGLDKLRKELISNISHDLRTPIASIRGYAETLEMKSDSLDKGEQKKYAEIILKSSEQLKKLVDDLFELSKLETNQIQLNKEVFSVGELVHDIANKYRLMSEDKGIHINTLVSKDAAWVNADVSMVDRVLQNLLDNALKFSNQGDTINIEVEGNNPNNVRLKIQDSGKGIAPEELPYIFNRYYKGQHKGGTGLGLAIVKKIVELHGSDIRVESHPHQGTAFEFELERAAIA
ncbi:MAG: HAMP domain-containing histidine kinase [Flavobacteriales bacterium]|nr:HAMP domain-containing histidine kinase [Flavobacteriales bacterium]